MNFPLILPGAISKNELSWGSKNPAYKFFFQVFSRQLSIPKNIFIFYQGFFFINVILRVKNLIRISLFFILFILVLPEIFMMELVKTWQFLPISFYDNCNYW